MLFGVSTLTIPLHFYIRHEERKQKLEVFRKLMANRHGLVPNGDPEINREFFRALNEAFAVFGKSKQVIVAIKAFKIHSDRASDNVIILAREVCKDLKIDTSFLEDEFFSEPFVPYNEKR